MQPIVNYGGYIPGRAPTKAMLSKKDATPQYIIDRENAKKEKIRNEILKKRKRRKDEDRKRKTTTGRRRKKTKGI